MTEKTITEIEAESVKAAVAKMLVIRPDLNKPTYIAIAEMVARDAISHAHNGFVEAGHLKPDRKSDSTETGFESVRDFFQQPVDVTQVLSGLTIALSQAGFPTTRKP